METVRVTRDDFISKVENNKAGHRATFESALDGYRDRAIHELERRVRHVREGRAFDLSFRLPEPEDHTADYDRVLEMARMSVDDVVELTESEFAQYVLDQWHWKANFAATTRAYTRRPSHG
jgi:hypothetical protein